MKDLHLNTGKYDPKKYWEARARSSKENIYKAVCMFSIPTIENVALEKMQQHVFDLLIKDINLKGSNVLEVGCGVGRWVYFITSRGASYIGVDISESMLEIARKRVPGGHFYKLNSNKLPFEDETFDFVFSITVIHHNPYEEQTVLIDELIRVTKPGGLILLMEGIAKKREQTFFNMFPRPKDDWIKEVTKNSRAQVVKIKHIHWWILRDVVFGLMRRMGISKASRENMKVLNAFLVKLGIYLDKYLLHLFPRRWASSAGMLFKKTVRDVNGKWRRLP